MVTAATAEAEPAAQVKKEEAPASCQPSAAGGPAEEQQDTRGPSGGNGNLGASGGYARLVKTNSAEPAGPGDKGVQELDKRSATSQQQNAAATPQRERLERERAVAEYDYHGAVLTDQVLNLMYFKLILYNNLGENFEKEDTE